MLKKIAQRALHVFQSMSDVNREIKSRRMRWVGYVARIGGKEKFVHVFGGET